jgi:hypothetical protein
MAPEESGSKQCPTCGSWDVRWAMIEDGGQGDWCDNCKKSLKAMEAQRYVRKKNIGGWVAIVIVVGGIYVLIAGIAGIANSRSVMLYNNVAQSDLRNAVPLQYAYYRDNKTYAPSIEILDYAVSEDVVIYVVSADESHFVMEGYHKEGDRLWEIRSDSKCVFWYKWKKQKKIGSRQGGRCYEVPPKQ